MKRGRVGGRGGSRGGQRAADRGLSPVLGVVLLVGIVVLGTIVVTLVGGVALDGSRSSVEISRAEGAMAELDARTSDTALGVDDTAARNVDFGPTGRDGHLETSRDSWIRVSVVNASTGVEDANVVNATLGTVTYANGATTVAYEGGGVWRADGEGSTMLSPPEFHFRNTTLTLPIINVSSESDPGLTERLSVRRAGPAVRKYPNASAGLGNRVEDSKVTITVHSDYYVAWGRYFEATTDGIVTYDHGAETATVKFLSIPKWVGLGDGIVATSGQGEVRIGGNSVYIDSYNSSAGTYAETNGSDGSIVAVNDVEATGTSDIQGEIRSGATLTLSGTTNINGAVYWTDGYDPKGAQVSGGAYQIDGVAAFEPIDGYVLNTVAEMRTSNDNANVTEIDDDQLVGSATLTSGDYYLRQIAVGPGNTLTLDTTDGDVVIAVEDTVTVEGNGGNAASLEVVGDGTVTMFVVGDEPVDFLLGKNGQVAVPDENSGQFRVYGTQEFDADITSNQGNTLRFEGVIYAPAGTTGSGSVKIGQADFYGAIVTGSLEIKQGANIHYDLGLGSERFPRSPTISRIEFMHVAVHEVDVTNR